MSFQNHHIWLRSIVIHLLELGTPSSQYVAFLADLQQQETDGETRQENGVLQAINNIYCNSFKFFLNGVICVSVQQVKILIIFFLRIQLLTKDDLFKKNHTFIHIQLIFFEHLLCTRHWVNSSEQSRKNFCPHGASIPVNDDRQCTE